MSGFKDAVKSGMTEYLEDLKKKLDGLTEAELRWQATLDSNTITWLVWHMARVEDGWINHTIAGGESAWDSGGGAEKTGVKYDNSGYGQDADDIRAMPPVPISVLVEYFDAVRTGSFRVIDAMTDDDIATEIDRGHGPITWGWILGHVLAEEAQHLGQVAFIRGMIRGINA
mgnify:CR=1 FL=1|jgi:hypothetical protein